MEETLSQPELAEAQTGLPQKIQQICEALSTTGLGLLKQGVDVTVQQGLQKALCKALLLSIHPDTMTHGSPHSRSKLARLATQQQATQQTLQDSYTAEGLVVHSDAEGSSQIPQSADNNPISSQCMEDLHTAPAAESLAEAWLTAGPALQSIYTWEHEDIVTSVITFWSDVSSLLCGGWLREGADDSEPKPEPDQLQEQQHYFMWLQQLGPPALAAVVQLLHDFCCLTGISHLQHKQRSQLLQLLLLFLQLQPCSSRDSLAQAAEQLLQMLQWPQPGGNSLASTTAAALTAGQSFTGVGKLLQMAAQGATANDSKSVGQQQQAAAAMDFLQTGYGWTPWGMQHAASTHCNSNSRRPEDTAYDCCMLEVLYSMYQGPSAPTAADVLQPPGTQLAAQKASPSSSRSSKEDKLQRQQWERWCDSNNFQALAQLIVRYDKPHLLTRGLMALVLQQQQQQQHALGSGLGAITAGVSALSLAQSEKAVINKVVQLFEAVYLHPHQDDGTQQAAAAGAGAVSKLLQGCAELLRPAANCTVEWRCAALNLMTTAVEDFTECHQDSGELHSRLWSDDALEGLLYCLNHDSSIKVRRTAMKLLQLVVLPSGSHAAVHLVKALAAKVCDKDSTVGQAALELLVQLDARTICNILTASQWSGVVQAGLQLCSAQDDTEHDVDGPSQGASKSGRHATKQSASQVMCSAGQKQFLQLLESVLMFVTAEVEQPPDHGHQQLQQMHSMHGHQIRQWLMSSAHRVVGLVGCRFVLLLVLQNRELETLCRSVAGASA